MTLTSGTKLGPYEVIKKLADIATAYVTGERGMGKYTGRRLSPTHDEVAQLAFSLYESRGKPEVIRLDESWFYRRWMQIIGEIRVPALEEFAGEVANSRWLRIQSVNRVFT
jgi:hypothetical protein